MSKIFVRQSGLRNANKRKKKISMIGGIVLPKEFLVIWHNQQEDKVIIKHQSGLKNEDCEHPNHLVTVVNLSDLSIYFSFLPAEEQIDAYTQLINMVAKVSHESLNEPGGNLMPTVLKKVYLRAIHFFKTLSSGNIVTEVFVSKLSSLVFRIWKHAQNYLDFCRNYQLASRSRGSTIRYEPVTEYVC